MKEKKGKDSAARPGKKSKKSEEQQYILRLYVAGMTLKSKQAILNIKEVCNTHLQDRCKLEVIDILRNPVLAAGEQIIATPTLIRKIPAPLRRFLGDMTEAERILVGVDLRDKATAKCQIRGRGERETKRPRKKRRHGDTGKVIDPFGRA